MVKEGATAQSALRGPFRGAARRAVPTVARGGQCRNKGASNQLALPRRERRSPTEPARRLEAAVTKWPGRPRPTGCGRRGRPSRFASDPAVRGLGEPFGRTVAANGTGAMFCWARGSFVTIALAGRICTQKSEEFEILPVVDPDDGRLARLIHDRAS